MCLVASSHFIGFGVAIRQLTKPQTQVVPLTAALPSSLLKTLDGRTLARMQTHLFPPLTPVPVGGLQLEQRRREGAVKVRWVRDNQHEVTAGVYWRQSRTQQLEAMGGAQAGRRSPVPPRPRIQRWGHQTPLWARRQVGRCSCDLLAAARHHHGSKRGAKKDGLRTSRGRHPVFIARQRRIAD